MSQGLQTLVRRIRSMAARPRLEEQTDRQLLDVFVRGEEAAFAVLVKRHGPLVMGVCRRVLQHAQDAEDAFQATFLVLARKAGSGRWHDSISNWLHGVAYRIALKARSGNLRRRHKELQAGKQEQAGPSADINWNDLRRVLDEELQRLPARYRSPLLLCYLEGKTRDEAAQRLGWSPGSVKGRLERGRELLRQRLEKRGLTLSAVLCASLLPESLASAAVPPTLSAATVQAGLAMSAGSLTGGLVSSHVLSLTQGVLHAMLWTKIKAGLALMVTVAALGIGGTVTYQALSGEGSGPASASPMVSANQGPADFLDSREPAEKSPQVALAGQEEQRRPRDRERRDNPLLRGRVKEIDLAKGTITLIAGDGRRPGGSKTFNLAGKDIKVSTTAGRPAKLTELREGHVVALRISAEEEVTAIVVEAPMIRGTPLSVDRLKKTITLVTSRASKKTFFLEPGIQLFLAGRLVNPESILEKREVVAFLTLDEKTVVALRDAAERPRDNPREAGRRPARPDVAGVIVGVHPDKNTIEVLVGNEELKIETFELAKDFQVLANGREPLALKLADLPRAIRVGLRLTEDKKTVAGIEVTPPVFRANISAVDAGKNTITLAGRGGDKTLPVAKEARIMIRGQPGVLADLKTGMPALVTLSLDRSQVVGIQASAEGRGGERR